MPLIRTVQINKATKIGIWQIAEDENFFRRRVDLEPGVHHWHKRLQHLAARYLLTELFPGFPLNDIRILESGKPVLPGDPCHFSLSHCGDFAAAIVSRTERVGIDIEIFTSKTEKVAHKFLSPPELEFIEHADGLPAVNKTVCWCAKEAVYKWYGNGGVDFREHILLQPFYPGKTGTIGCRFKKDELSRELSLTYFLGENFCTAWVGEN